MKRFLMGLVSCVCLLSAIAGAQGLYVIGTDPLEGATNVPTNAVVRFTFDKELDPNTITPGSIMANSGPTDLQPMWTLGSSGVGPPNDMLVVTFLVQPPEYAQVQVELDGSIGAADLMSTLGNPYMLMYTTGAAAPFGVTSTTPAAGDTSVSPWWNASIQFNATLDPATVNPNTVWAMGEKDGISRTFTVSIMAYGNTIQVWPENLQPKLREQITVTVSTGVMSDTGEPLAEDYVLTFRTVGRPHVSSTWPNEYTPTKDIGRDIVIMVTIDPWYDMQTANEANVIVTSQEYGVLSGLQIKSMGMNMIEIHHSPFDGLDSITVELTEGITADGEPLVPYTFGFRVREFEPIRVALECPGYVHPIGGSVEVPVRILDDVTGRGIVAFQFRVTFDPSVVQFDSVSVDGTMPQTIWGLDSLVVGQPWPGEVYVSQAVFEPELAGIGLLARLHFTHIGGLTYTQTYLNLSDVDGIFFNEGDPSGRLDVQLTGVSVQFEQVATVSGVVMYAESGVPVDSAVVHLKFTQRPIEEQATLTGPDGTFSFSNVPLGQVQLRVESIKEGGRAAAISAMDASYVLQTVVRNRFLSSLAQRAADVTHNGQVAAYDASRILGYLVGAVPDFGPAWWLLDVAEQGSSQAEVYVTEEGVYVDVTAQIVGDVTASWNPLLAKRASGPPRTLDLSTAQPGIWSLRTTDSSPVFGAEIQLTTAEPVAVSDVTSVDGWLVAWNAEGTTLRIAIAGSEPITDPTELLAIHTTSGVAPTFERMTVKLNEGEIAAEMVLNHPRALALHPAAPNPFNPSTQLIFELPDGMAVRLTVVNALGQHVRTLVDERMAAGVHRVTWNALDDQGRAAASGLYIVSLRADNGVLRQRVLLVK